MELITHAITLISMCTSCSHEYKILNWNYSRINSLWPSIWWQSHKIYLSHQSLKLAWKIIHLKFDLNLQGANELMSYKFAWYKTIHYKPLMHYTCFIMDIWPTSIWPSRMYFNGNLNWNSSIFIQGWYLKIPKAITYQIFCIAHINSILLWAPHHIAKFQSLWHTQLLNLEIQAHIIFQSTFWV